MWSVHNTVSAALSSSHFPAASSVWSSSHRIVSFANGSNMSCLHGLLQCGSPVGSFRQKVCLKVGFSLWLLPEPAPAWALHGLPPANIPLLQWILCRLQVDLCFTVVLHRLRGTACLTMLFNRLRAPPPSLTLVYAELFLSLPPACHPCVVCPPVSLSLVSLSHTHTRACVSCGELFTLSHYYRECYQHELWAQLLPVMGLLSPVEPSVSAMGQLPASSDRAATCCQHLAMETSCTCLGKSNPMPLLRQLHVAWN